jgi:hypothetical protein
MDDWGSLTPDQRADRLAARQRALITHAQARWCGVSPRQIENRRASGRWLDVCRGLYRVAGAPTTWRQKALAPCLIGPRDTVASHLTAAAAANLAAAPSLPHATAQPGRSVLLPVATWHRAPIAKCDRTSIDGLPVTTVPRTIVDCAAILAAGRWPTWSTAHCAGAGQPSRRSKRPCCAPARWDVALVCRGCAECSKHGRRTSGPAARPRCVCYGCWQRSATPRGLPRIVARLTT